jgi:HEAT repeat protein
VANILERFVSRPTEAGLAKADREAIRGFLGRLDKFEAGLGEAACDYVVTGAADEVLLKIVTAYQNKLTNAQRHTHNVTQRALLGFEVDVATQQVFLTPESWNPAVARRLGELLAVIATKGGWAAQLPGSASSPEFFRALALVTARSLNHLPVPPPAAAWLLNGPRCLELLASAGADQAALVEVLFAVPGGGGVGPRRLRGMHELADALAVAAERTLFGARALDADGRCSFIECLGSIGLSSRPAFLDFLFATLTHAGKRESEVALAAIMACGAGQVTEKATRLLQSEHSDERGAAVRALANAGTPQARSLLEGHVLTERSARVREQIAHALRSLKAIESAGEAPVASGAGYSSINGEWIVIPAPPALPPDTPPPADLKGPLRAAAIEANREARRIFDEHQRQYAQLSAEQQQRYHGPKAYQQLYAVEATGELMDVIAGKLDPRKASQEVRGLTGRGHYWYRSAAEQYWKKVEALLCRPGITPHHLARLLALDLLPYSNWARVLIHRHPLSVLGRLLREKAEAAGDFRPVFLACDPVGGGSATIIEELLRSPGWQRLYTPQLRTLLWAAVAEHLGLIDRALGLAPVPAQSGYSRLSALELLGMLPAPPRRHLPVLLDLAVEGTKEEKLLSRALLSSAPGVTELIIPLLASGEQSRRMAAAQWLRERGDREAIPQLRAALGKEKTDAARAVFLHVLVAFGEDISEQFSEERLLEEASSGLARTRTKVDRCVALDHLPVLKWADGRTVPPEVVRWWVVLADKLKSGRGNPLLNLVLDRLEPSCAARLACLVLSSWVAFDIRRPSEEEANAFAEANADGLLQSYRRWRPDFTREQAFARLKAQKLAEYLQSAQEHRGVLALARCAPGAEAAGIVKAYFRDHYGRSAQCKALLDGLANNPAPLALQLILGISMRHRTRSVRRHAAALVTAIAEERGWTRDELGDRTAPTGGLDERGALRLSTGEEAYEARVNSGLQIVLRNPQGRIVKSLPAAGGETAAAAKKALSNLRKELKETIPQQSARLYEAMCAGRAWRCENIGGLLFRHPIVGRLCERLVFAGLDAGGTLLETFRPLGDGSLTNTADEELDLASFRTVRIAHRVLLPEEQVAAWQQHLVDYEVTPLFEQLSRGVLRLDPAQADATAIKEREGYMLDTFALRAAAAKLGYQHGPAEDGAWFTTYRKPFTAAGLTAIIDFTGSALTQTNVPCALLGLRFLGEGEHAGGLSLSAVPPVLLSETWNDLRQIAALGSGFDAEWQKKVRW